jgi:hypothetical protein
LINVQQTPSAPNVQMVATIRPSVNVSWPISAPEIQLELSAKVITKTCASAKMSNAKGKSTIRVNMATILKHVLVRSHVKAKSILRVQMDLISILVNVSQRR